MQRNHNQRNDDLIQLCRAGNSARDVARQFRITPNRVRQIVNRDARELEATQRASRWAAEIRLADNLDLKWPVVGLLDALAVPTPTRRALELHWAGDALSKSRVSLRELMDLVAAPPPNGREYVSVPVLRVRGVGGYGFRVLLHAIQRLNLHGVCRADWLRRFDLDARSWRIQGGENYYWSMPNPFRRPDRLQ